MIITERLLTPNKYSRPQIPLQQVSKIAVHYVGNPMSSALANRNYFDNLRLTHERYVSAHFVIGLEGEIIRCVPLDEVAYCTNSANAYSVSIECCHPDSTGKFTEKTEQSLVELTAYLLEKYALTADDIIRHYDVTGKCCPKYYVDNPAAYEDFKKRVSELIGGRKTMYSVQAGAFSSLENAQRYLEEVKKTFPAAFIRKIEAAYK